MKDFFSYIHKKLTSKEKTRKKSWRPKTFTYYVPAPPHKRQGHQEKEFDEAMRQLAEYNVEILDIKLQSFSQSQAAGLWIVCLYRPLDQKASEFESKDHAGLLDKTPPSSEIYPVEFDFPAGKS